MAEIETRQILNQIHCYFLHSFDTGYRFSEKELRELNRYDHGDRKESIVCNEGNMDSDEGMSDDDSFDDADDDHMAYSVVDAKLSKTCQLILERKQQMLRSRSRHRTRRKKDKYGRERNVGGGGGGGHHGGGNQGHHSEVVDNLERNYRKYCVWMDCHESGALNVYGKKFYYWYAAVHWKLLSIGMVTHCP